MLGCKISNKKRASNNPGVQASHQVGVHVKELDGHLLERPLRQQVALDAAQRLMRVVVRLGESSGVGNGHRLTETCCCTNSAHCTAWQCSAAKVTLHVQANCEIGVPNCNQTSAHLLNEAQLLALQLVKAHSHRVLLLQTLQRLAQGKN